MAKLINREFKHDVLHLIQERWSSRAFDTKRHLEEEDLQAILEAGSYAPSCFNEQPWRAVVARKGTPVFDAIVSTLTPGNQAWAPFADVLMVILSKKTFSRNDQPNRFSQFDAGAAWGFLLLEAQKRGILAHPMGGYDLEQIREKLQISEDLDILAIAAIGYYGKGDYLPEKYKAREVPSPRRNVEELLIHPVIEETEETEETAPIEENDENGETEEQ